MTQQQQPTFEMSNHRMLMNDHRGFGSLAVRPGDFFVRRHSIDTDRSTPESEQATAQIIHFNESMKSVSTIIALLAVASPASAFVFPKTTASSIATRTRLFAEPSPELEKAIAEVRECASAFGEETAHFANVWIDKMLEGKQEGMAAGLLDECLIDDDADKCAKYDAALKKLDSLLGVGAGEQF